MMAISLGKMKMSLEVVVTSLPTQILRQLRAQKTWMTPDEDENDDDDDDDDAAAAAGDYDDMCFAKSILYVSTTLKAHAAAWLADTGGVGSFRICTLLLIIPRDKRRLGVFEWPFSGLWHSTSSRCQVGLQMDSNIDPETKETEGRAMGLCPPKGLRLKISGLYHFPLLGRIMINLRMEWGFVTCDTCSTCSTL